MDLNAYRDEIKFRLTGNMLELELDDASLDKVINIALREIQRYICSTKLITVPFSKCIDLSTVEDEEHQLIKVSSVSRIYRTQGYIMDSDGKSVVDPMQAAQWQVLSGTGNLYNFQDYVYNYLSWNTLQQIRNTTSTDFAFRYDKASNKLYINTASDNPSKVTVEYVPRYDTVDEITSDYWIDMLIRLAVALTKVTVGNIRSRYTQANALWTQDGQQMRDEGNNELNALREDMQKNSQLVYPID